MGEAPGQDAHPVTRRPSPGPKAPPRSVGRPAVPARRAWPPRPFDALYDTAPGRRGVGTGRPPNRLSAQVDPWPDRGPGDATLVAAALSGAYDEKTYGAQTPRWHTDDVDIPDVDIPGVDISGVDISPEWAVDNDVPPAEWRSRSSLYRSELSSRRKPIRTGRRKVRRTPVWAVVLIVLGSLITIGGTGAAFVVQSLVNTVSGDVHQQDLLGDTVARDATGGVSITGVINMLLVGIDTRVANPAMGSRADSIIIAHVPAGHDRVDLISIPRDTNVTIPASPKTGFSGGQARINAAFQFGSMHGGGADGGFQLLAKTIKSMFGISFQGGAIVNFDGFTDIVHKLGGVDMYVDEKTTSLHDGFRTGTHTRAAPFATNDGGLHWTPVRGVTPMIYNVGYQHLTPAEALDFVRIRDFLPNGDYDRERHQQQFIKAVLTEAYRKGLQNPLQAGSFMASISKAFVFSGGGVSISNWLFTLKAISPTSMVLLKVNDGTYNTLHVPRPGGGFDAREVLSAKSRTLMADVATDQVDRFIAANPSWASS